MIHYFHCYAETLTGELNPGLKVNLNEHSSVCYLIQIWIGLKKLYLDGKWQNQCTHEFVSIFSICRNFIWMKNWTYITSFRAKFPNQWKRQSNNKVPSNTLSLHKASSWICWLNLCEK